MTAEYLYRIWCNVIDPAVFRQEYYADFSCPDAPNSQVTLAQVEQTWAESTEDPAHKKVRALLAELVPSIEREHGYLV